MKTGDDVDECLFCLWSDLALKLTQNECTHVDEDFILHLWDGICLATGFNVNMGARANVYN